jgi:hypothetical protein
MLTSYKEKRKLHKQRDDISRITRDLYTLEQFVPLLHPALKSPGYKMTPLKEAESRLEPALPYSR